MPGRFQDSLANITGVPHVAARVEVHPAGQPSLADGIYADGDGEYPLANPLPSASAGRPGLDRTGLVTFYADPTLTYDIWVTDGSRTFGPYNVAPAAATGAATIAPGTYAELIALAGSPDLLIAGTITRDANDAATSAPVVWPNGTVGTYTATTVSTAFPGAVYAYTITYGSPVTRTYTSAALTLVPVSCGVNNSLVNAQYGVKALSNIFLTGRPLSLQVRRLAADAADTFAAAVYVLGVIIERAS